MDGLLFDLPVATPSHSRAKRRNARRKKPPAPQWPLDGAINVVLFAGMGGACQGLEEAGFPVHVAVNHDEVAIAAHRALNPHTKHLHADIYEVCPVDATNGRPVNILWGSPDCRDHSVAKGGAPRSPRVRSMPWQMCRWIGVLRKRGLGPAVAYLENVREIRGWGPLVAKRDKATGRVLKLDGSVAAPGERVPRAQQQLVRDPKRVGRTYRAWVRHMQSLGARYEDRDLRCSSYGVPTSRARLFGVAVFDDYRPICWPTVTHGPRNSAAVLAGKLLPERSAAEIIDWSLPLPSIFDRPKDLAPATQRRIAVGMKRFVLEAEQPFLVHLTHHGDRQPMSVDDAPPTFTGAHRGEMAVVGAAVVGAGGRAGQSHPFDIGRPLNASTTKEDRVLAAAHLVGIAHGDDAKSGSRTYDALDALRTATGSNDQAIIAAHLTRYHGERRPGEERGATPGQSLPTQTTENRFGIVGAALAPAMMANNTNNVGASMLDGVPALTTGNRDYVLGAMLVSTSNTGTTGRAPYVWHPDESLRTLLTSGSQAVVAATMVQTGYGERDGQAPRALDLQQPLGTLVAGGAKHAVVGAYMLQHNTGVIGHSVVEGLSTVTAGGRAGMSPQAIGAAYLTELRGTSADGQPVTDPAGTMCTGGGRGGGHDAVTAAFLHHQYSSGGQHDSVVDPLATQSTRDRTMVTGAAGAVPPLTPEKLARARQVADFLRRHGVWDDRPYVTFGCWIVVDIGMRMLTPREAAAAHELRMPDAITVPKRDRKGAIVTDEAGKPVMVTRPLTKTEAMRLVGNSVPKRMAKLLAQANAMHALQTAPSIAAE